MGRAFIFLVVIAALLFGFAAGRASDRDETIFTARITSADHEAAEGYFSLGDRATLMVRPGTDLYGFLNRHRGHKVKVTLTEDENRQLSRLDKRP